MGKILAICTSPRRGTLKTPVPSAVLTPEWGIVGDAHGGSWHRQVSLLSAEKIEAFRQKLWVDYGAFGENLVVEGFDLATLPVPSFFAIGDAVLEMTQIGKECHNDCVIKQQTGECIMAPGGRICPVLKGRRDSCRRRSDPSAAAGRSAAARCGHHPVRQGQPGRAGGQERPPHRGDAHRRRLCGGRDDAPARRGQGAESTAHPSGRWPSGEPYPDHRRHRLLAPGHPPPRPPMP